MKVEKADGAQVSDVSLHAQVGGSAMSRRLLARCWIRYRSGCKQPSFGARKGRCAEQSNSMGMKAIDDVCEGLSGGGAGHQACWVV